MSIAPRRQDGFWSWRTSHEDVEIYFGGKGPRLDPEAVLRRVLPAGIELAGLNQIHSAIVLDARPGELDGRPGDSLVTERSGLALVVVTADCVPVLIAAGSKIAAVHAGWRGLAQSILPATIERLSATGPMTAWLGPAIGPCCYEVGTEVAEKVCAESAPEVVRDGPRNRPHLDLIRAVRTQLERQGVRDVRALDVCTRCDEKRLYSYRREGPGTGRNVAAIWRAR